jgi:hypothetical protein
VAVAIAATASATPEAQSRNVWENFIAGGSDDACRWWWEDNKEN